jgi:hypothetical protein
MPGPVIAFEPSVPSVEAASARLRCYLPMRYLREAGRECELFDPARLERYRVVVFQKAYAPKHIEFARTLRARGVPTVFDLCDNHLFAPPGQPALAERAVRLREMLSLMTVVTVCTPDLGRALDRDSVVIDDALDEVGPAPLSDLRRRARRWLGGPARLVWFGNAGMDCPAFGLIDLARIVPELNALHARTPVRLTVISNSRELFARHTAGARFHTRYREYRTQTFQTHFRRNDICLVPVTHNPFTLCKTVNRPALSLLLGLPVVADALPSYEELRPFVPFDDWAGSLRRYIENPRLCRGHVCEAQRYLRSRYSPGHVVEQWQRVLEPLAA